MYQNNCDGKVKSKGNNLIDNKDMKPLIFVGIFFLLPIKFTINVKSFLLDFQIVCLNAKEPKVLMEFGKSE